MEEHTAVVADDDVAVEEFGTNVGEHQSTVNEGREVNEADLLRKLKSKVTNSDNGWIVWRLMRVLRRGR